MILIFQKILNRMVAQSHIGKHYDELVAKSASHKQVLADFQRENRILANGHKAIIKHNEDVFSTSYESSKNWILAKVALGEIQSRSVKHIIDPFWKVRTGEAQGDCIKAVEQGVAPSVIREQRAAVFPLGTAELNRRTLSCK